MNPIEVITPGLKRHFIWLHPEQVSECFRQNQEVQISHKLIYQHILADKRAEGDLYLHLRCQKERRKRYGSYDWRGQIPNRVSIEERPAIVGERTRIGEWEVSTIISKEHCQAIITLMERKSRFCLLAKVHQHTTYRGGDTVIKLLQPVADRLHNLTADNGKEFANHKRVASVLQSTFFFAHPNAALKGGANENMNGLIRQYIPKSKDFSAITNVYMFWIMNRLNHRPQKCLDSRSPFEVFFDQSVALTSRIQL